MADGSAGGVKQIANEKKIDVGPARPGLQGTRIATHGTGDISLTNDKE